MVCACARACVRVSSAGVPKQRLGRCLGLGGQFLSDPRRSSTEPIRRIGGVKENKSGRPAKEKERAGARKGNWPGRGTGEVYAVVETTYEKSFSLSFFAPPIRWRHNGLQPLRSHCAGGHASHAFPPFSISSLMARAPWSPVCLLCWSRVRPFCVCLSDNAQRCPPTSSGRTFPFPVK